MKSVSMTIQYHQYNNIVYHSFTHSLTFDPLYCSFHSPFLTSFSFICCVTCFYIHFSFYISPPPLAWTTPCCLRFLPLNYQIFGTDIFSIQTCSASASCWVGLLPAVHRCHRHCVHCRFCCCLGAFLLRFCRHLACGWVPACRLPCHCVLPARFLPPFLPAYHVSGVPFLQQPFLLSHSLYLPFLWALFSTISAFIPLPGCIPAPACSDGCRCWSKISGFLYLLRYGFYITGFSACLSPA